MGYHGTSRSGERAEAVGSSEQNDVAWGRLTRWLAEARADEAAARQVRERWLGRQAAEEATVGGVLMDLAEHEGRVLVTAVGGDSISGVVRAVGRDFVALGGDSPNLALVSLAVVALVQPLAGHPPVTGDRPLRASLGLNQVLTALANDREPVVITTRDGINRVRGRVESVGSDVVTLRTEEVDGGPAITYLPLPSVGQVRLG